MEHGRRAESEVARLCGDLFLKDFVLEAPKYRTRSGQLREAADALLPYGDTLIAMQVKTRTIGGGVINGGSLELQRVLRRVKDAANQVKTVMRALKVQALEEGETLRGVRVPLATRPYSRIIGIVVVDVFDAGGGSVVSQMQIQKGFTVVRGIPVHIFRACDFRVIAKEQDTIPDLLNYLTTRQNLLGGGISVPLVAELDLFGLFKTRYPLIEEWLSGDTRVVPPEPGLWVKVHRDYAEQWAERRQRMIPSYLVDKTIEEVHTCIGYDPTSEYPPDVVKQTVARAGPSSAVEYWEIVQCLGRLSRIERAQFGSKMYEKAQAADSKPFAFTVIYRFPDVGPIVYLCSNEPRHERAERLHFLMKCACAHVGTAHAVGIATQSLSAQKRSYDFAVMENVSFLDQEEAKRISQSVFGPPKGTSYDEWGRDYARST